MKIIIQMNSPITTFHGKWKETIVFNTSFSKYYPSYCNHQSTTLDKQMSITWLKESNTILNYRLLKPYFIYWLKESNTILNYRLLKPYFIYWYIQWYMQWYLFMILILIDLWYWYWLIYDIDLCNDIYLLIYAMVMHIWYILFLLHICWYMQCTEKHSQKLSWKY